MKAMTFCAMAAAGVWCAVAPTADAQTARLECNYINRYTQAPMTDSFLVNESQQEVRLWNADANRWVSMSSVRFTADTIYFQVPYSSLVTTISRLDGRYAAAGGVGRCERGETPSDILG